MAANDRVTLYHVEDNPDWREKIEHLVQDLDEMEYVGLEGPIDGDLEVISASAGPAIAIFDLRLGGVESEYLTLLRIMASVNVLQRLNIEVFILTGFLSKGVAPVLVNQGIREDHIFVKAPFKGDRLARLLASAGSKAQKPEKPAELGPFRLVHLSDIHLGQEPESRSFHKDIRNEILLDLKRLSSDRGSAHGLAIVGDMAFSGKSAEYAEVAEWIGRACEAIGCAPSSVFVVPGNHDVDHSEISLVVKDIHDRIRSAKDRELNNVLSTYGRDETMAAQLLTKLADYRAFAAGYDCDFESFENPHWVRDTSVVGAPAIRFVGINTVLLSDINDENGKMVAAEQQFMVERTTSVEYVALMHHPVWWLKNASSIKPYLDSRFRLILSGHEHKQTIQKVTDINGVERLEIYSGATNPKRSALDAEYRFNWLEISTFEAAQLREMVVTVYPRVWTSSVTEFVPDSNLLRGDVSRKYRLPLPSR